MERATQSFSAPEKVKDEVAVGDILSLTRADDFGTMGTGFGKGEIDLGMIIPKKDLRRKFLLLLVLFLLNSCDWADIKVYVQNDSSQQLVVRYKESQGDFDFHFEEEFPLGSGEKTKILQFEHIGEIYLYGSAYCKPFLLEYIIVKDTQEQVLYTQRPTNLDLWDCSYNAIHDTCSCVFTITDGILVSPNDQPDTDLVGG